MSCRRLALAPLVALLLSGLGGSAASAATSSTAEPTATSAATKKKKKTKKATVTSLDKRLKKTEKDLAAARKQLRIVQKATASLVSGLDTVVGANGSIEALLGGGLGSALGPELSKFDALLSNALAEQSNQIANAAVVAMQNPALKPELEKLLTGIFGVSPTTIGQSVANLGPTVQAALGQLIQQEQPVIIVRTTNGDQAKSILGPDVPDDANPVTVSASVPLKVTGAGDVQILAGLRSLETDNGHDEVILDSLEVTNGSGVTVGGGGGGVRVGSSAFTVPSAARLARTSDPGSLPGLDIAGSQMTDPVGTAAGKITLSGTGYVMVRVTARFKDNIPAD
ncbi:hypothetical protein LRS13_12970 [Svornostia abyssi]|uniref:Uncharacterized protein n=1 Tax=Svornostia abyssi TaxID=2898438 RepID=A0ABY5PAZ4_9ACTN|nr:hypothetical protein LRS13_12970 [Parviterribacteraceae bacterium J379]